MKVKDAIEHILLFGKEYKVRTITDSKNILIMIRDKFAEKCVVDLSTLDLAPFLKSKLGLNDKLLNGYLRRTKSLWNSNYDARYASNQVASLKWERHTNNTLRNLFNSRRFNPKRVLELGCGSGRDAIFMAQKGCDVTAVDISPIAIEIATKRAEMKGVKCSFVVNNIFDLKLKKKSFDLILDNGCFHHVPFLLHGSYVKMILELLIARGYFYLLCHNPNPYPINYLSSYLGPTLTKTVNYLFNGVAESYFTEKEIRMIFSDRFKICRISTVYNDQNKPFDYLECLMKKF